MMPIRARQCNEAQASKPRKKASHWSRHPFSGRGRSHMRDARSEEEARQTIRKKALYEHTSTGTSTSTRFDAFFLAPAPGPAAHITKAYTGLRHSPHAANIYVPHTALPEAAKHVLLSSTTKVGRADQSAESQAARRHVEHLQTSTARRNEPCTKMHHGALGIFKTPAAPNRVPPLSVSHVVPHSSFSERSGRC